MNLNQCPALGPANEPNIWVQQKMNLIDRGKGVWYYLPLRHGRPWGLVGYGV